MNSSPRNRVSKGVTTGGQFSAESKSEDWTVALTAKAALAGLAAHRATDPTPTSEAERIVELPDHERWVKVNGDTVRIDRVDYLAKTVIARQSEVRGLLSIPLERMSMPDRDGALKSHPNVNFADPEFANRHEGELHSISTRAMGPNPDFDSAPADVDAVVQWSRKQAEPLDINDDLAMHGAINELRSDYTRDFGDDQRMDAPDRHFKSLLRTVWEDEDCTRYLAEKDHG